MLRMMENLAPKSALNPANRLLLRELLRVQPLQRHILLLGLLARRSGDGGIGRLILTEGLSAAEIALGIVPRFRSWRCAFGRQLRVLRVICCCAYCGAR